MDKSQLLTEVKELRGRVCDQLADLTSEQWETPSLCAGWRVRDVAGHLVSLQEVPVWKFWAGAFGIRGYHRRVDRFARAFGARPPVDLVRAYRRHATSDKVPPGIGPIAPPCDLTVHALDIQRPLGLPPVDEPEATRQVLARLCTGLPAFNSRRRVGGLRYEATDLERSHGDGPTVRGASSDVLLAVMGRPVEPTALDGDGVGVLLGRA